MKRVILFYKPYGVLSQFTRLGAHRTLAEFSLPKDVYPVGRLDHDSEGLMLLTDDGHIQHRLSDPRYDHPKVYWAQVERVPDDAALEDLRRGVELGDGRSKPCEVRLLQGEPVLPPRTPPIRFRKSVPTAWIELTLREGRNRQVRRMTAAVGYPTLRLVRVRVAGLKLSGLAPGRWRELSAHEVKALRAELAASVQSAKPGKRRKR